MALRRAVLGALAVVAVSVAQAQETEADRRFGTLRTAPSPRDLMGPWLGGPRIEPEPWPPTVSLGARPFRPAEGSLMDLLDRRFAERATTELASLRAASLRIGPDARQAELGATAAGAGDAFAERPESLNRSVPPALATRPLGGPSGPAPLP